MLIMQRFTSNKYVYNKFNLHNKIIIFDFIIGETPISYYSRRKIRIILVYIFILYM